MSKDEVTEAGRNLEVDSDLKLMDRMKKLISLQSEIIEDIKDVNLTGRDINSYPNKVEGNCDNLVIVEPEDQQNMLFIAACIDNNSKSSEISIDLDDNNTIKIYISLQEQGVSVNVNGLTGSKLNLNSIVEKDKTFILVNFIKGKEVS